MASVFSRCGASDNTECRRVSHSLAIKIGVFKNMYVANALLGMYSKCRHIKNAIQAFRDVPESNEVSFIAMLSGLLETDHVYEALDLFSLMHRNGVCIDFVLSSDITGVCGVRRSEESRFFAQGGELLLDVYGQQVYGYGERFQSEKAIECLQTMQHSGFEPDEVTYINMLAACIKSDDIETAHQIFDRMITFAVILSSCAAMGLLQSGKQLNYIWTIMLLVDLLASHSAPKMRKLSPCLNICERRILKDGHVNDTFVGSALIDMYCKCGNMDEDLQFFDAMPLRNTAAPVKSFCGFFGKYWLLDDMGSLEKFGAKHSKALGLAVSEQGDASLALVGKLGWSMTSNKHILWVRLLNAKYFKRQVICFDSKEATRFALVELHFGGRDVIDGACFKIGIVEHQFSCLVHLLPLILQATLPTARFHHIHHLFRHILCNISSSYPSQPIASVCSHHHRFELRLCAVASGSVPVAPEFFSFVITFLCLLHRAFACNHIRLQFASNQLPVMSLSTIV
ncbi:Pentatricopeptide repeat [Dillenia turbinata]|uniref:Pentatricopeptide repeat n=1 Tax=Dillenia turbinata TaxID=194707 RepID=A0AAN8VCE1_9MAGN